MIREFINNNNITFEKGNRNPTMITLIGYSLYLNLNKEDLENELSEEIKKDNFLQEEIDRLWTYCYDRNYDVPWRKGDYKSIFKY